MRADFSDTALRGAIYDLLDTAFPRLSERIRIAERLGASWHAVSVPFVRFAGPVVVAHAGVMTVPLIVHGRPVDVGAIHAVCTRPEHRGQGHFRAAMAEALEYCDRHFVATWLFTSRPALYEPFGFRVVPEHLFEMRADVRTDGPSKFERIDATRPGELERLHDLLAMRAPPSGVLSVVDPGWLFIINEVLASWGLARLYRAPDLECIAAYTLEHRTLHLLDVVAEQVPDVSEVLRRIPGSFERIILHITPDRLGGGPWQTVPHDPQDHLMVRGSLDLGRQPFCVPPLGHT